MSEVSVGNHIIRRANKSDIPFIMDFLDRYWEKACILSRDRAYFEYEFVVDDKVNFVVAVHKETGAIEATQAYIQCSKKPLHDGFSGAWVCKPRCGTKFLGITLNRIMPDFLDTRKLVGVGFTAKGESVASRLFKPGDIAKLAHYYRLAKRDRYSIAHVVRAKYAECETESNKKLIPIPTIEHLKAWFDFDTLPDVPMYKDLWYVEHRYYNHPYYRFNIWGIEETPGKIEGLLVGRTVKYNGSACLRIMDLFGPDSIIDGIGPELDRIMHAGDMEYVDFYCAEIPQENMQNAGFVLKDVDDENIIPNHFEPYERKNIDIIYSGAGLKATKGDGDQGRPKRLRLPCEWRN